MADLQDKHAHEVRLPHRSRRYGVGKEIAGKVYVHCDYADRPGVISCRLRLFGENALVER